MVRIVLNRADVPDTEKKGPISLASAHFDFQYHEEIETVAGRQVVYYGVDETRLKKLPAYFTIVTTAELQQVATMAMLMDEQEERHKRRDQHIIELSVGLAMMNKGITVLEVDSVDVQRLQNEYLLTHTTVTREGGFNRVTYTLSRKSESIIGEKEID